MKKFLPGYEFPYLYTTPEVTPYAHIIVNKAAFFFKKKSHDSHQQK